MSNTPGTSTWKERLGGKVEERHNWWRREDRKKGDREGEERKDAVKERERIGGREKEERERGGNKEREDGYKGR